MMCEKKEKEKDLNISVENLLAILNSDFRRQDGEFIYLGGKYKYSAYQIGSPGGITFRIDIREANK